MRSLLLALTLPLAAWGFGYTDMCPTGTVDACGVCDGPGLDCADGCDGAMLDECGMCNGTGMNPGACDCQGSMLDSCGVCGGMDEKDCDGVCIIVSGNEICEDEDEEEENEEEEEAAPPLPPWTARRWHGG